MFVITHIFSHNIQKAFGRLKRSLSIEKFLLPEPAKLHLAQPLILPIVHYCYPVYGKRISRAITERIKIFQYNTIVFVNELTQYNCTIGNPPSNCRLIFPRGNNVIIIISMQDTNVMYSEESCPAQHTPQQASLVQDHF